MPTDKEPVAGASPPASPGKPRADSRNMLPPRERRRHLFERLLVRLVATCGIVGIGVAIAAIMTSSRSQGWLIGLVVSIVSVVLAAVLWSSRQL
jgi:protein-S-isoprenylcysteine O-methyltransferase Ste14